MHSVVKTIPAIEAAFSTAGSNRYLVGVGYQLSDKVSVGASYLSKLGMNFKDGLVKVVDDTYVRSDQTIEDPSRVSMGISIDWDIFKLNTDVHLSNWSDTTMQDQGWKDGTMVCVGGEYFVKPEVLSLCFGYNYSTDVVSEGSNISFENAFYNTIISPSVLNQELTAGISYKVNKSIGLDFAVSQFFGESFKQSGTTTLGENELSFENKVESDSFLTVSTAISYLF